MEIKKKKINIKSIFGTQELMWILKISSLYTFMNLKRNNNKQKKNFHVL